MDRAQRIREKLDATITEYRLAGRKFNVNDLLADIELEQLAKRNGNGNGAEPERVVCWCDEGIISGQRVPVHRPCDCEYTARRSALVFEASRIATQKVGNPIGGSPATGKAWSRVFNSEMDRLAAPLLRQ